MGFVTKRDGFCRMAGLPGKAAMSCARDCAVNSKCVLEAELLEATSIP